MRVRVQLLGPVRVHRDGDPVRLSPRERAVIAVLALNVGRVVTPSTLIDALWAESPPATAANAVQVYMSRLRGLLDSAVIAGEPAGYRLTIAAADVDSVSFEHQAAAAATALRERGPRAASGLLHDALGLWQGQALADVDAPYADLERTRLEESRLGALESRIECDLALGAGPELAEELNALVARHPFRERLVAALMTVLYRGGRQADALAVYQRARQMFVDELGLEPGAELRQVHAAVLSQDRTLISTADPAGEPLRGSPLPAPATSTVGRAGELAALGEMLTDPGVRLISLVGPGGVGKTRLAVVAAQAVGSRFRDGACWVPLRAVADGEQLLAGIAHAIGLRDDERRLSDAIADRLATRELLLVVDNAEHLVAYTRVFADLLEAAPGLKLLVTTRTALNLSAEHRFDVPPLGLPSAGVAVDDLKALPGYGAVALFVARTRAKKPGFALTAGNARTVVETCRRLDGLPLAIELASARANVLSPQALLRRLENRLDLLDRGPADLPSQQRTLRATIGWSYQLLDAAAQTLFERLAVFSGDFGLDAAAPVGGAGDVLGDLATLVDSSLVRRFDDPDGESRFVLLTTIREYAAERLDEHGETETVARRHAGHYLAVAEAAAGELWGQGQLRWFDLLQGEHDNFRTALRFLISQRSAAAVRLASALSPLWEARGFATEGRESLQAALDACPGAPPADRARAMFSASRLTGLLGDRRAEAALLQSSAELFGTAGDVRGEAFVLSHLGVNHAVLAEGAGEEAAERSVQLARDLGDRWLLAMALNNRGYGLVWAGQTGPEVAAWLTESLALRRELGEKRGIAFTLTTLGEMALLRGEAPAAAAYFEESAVLGADLGHTELSCISGLGFAKLAMDDRAGAEEVFTGCARRSLGFGFRDLLGEAMIGLALLRSTDSPAAAAHLVAAASALLTEGDKTLSALQRRTHDQIVSVVRDRLGDEAFAAAWSAGQRTAPDRILAVHG